MSSAVSSAQYLQPDAGVCSGRQLSPAAVAVRRGRAQTQCVRASSYSDRFESSEIRYDEYYNGDTLLNERDVSVRDVTWAELSRIKEFEQENPATFNAYMKVGVR